MGSLFRPKAPPAPPSASEVARETAEVNRVTQYTPTGNLIYGTTDPNTGEFIPDYNREALQVEETPFQSQLRLGTEQQLLDLLGSISPNGGLPDVRTAQDIESLNLPSLLTDFSGDTQRLEQATYDLAVNRMQPQFDRQIENLEQRLADQGLPMGSEAYDEALKDLRDQQSEQLSRVALESIQTGRAEQDRLARLSAALRGQGFNEQLALAQLEQQQRARPFSELGTLMGAQTPFIQQSITPIDVAGISQAGYQNQLANYQQRQAQSFTSPQNLGALGITSALMFSDKELKENIEKVGRKNGYNLYKFNYIFDKNIKYIGVIAQEVQEKMPNAVKEVCGYLAVDYSKLGFKPRICYV